ncbi:AraC family transcriptional regulator [marine bacterium AO1-C]|nr:AraC family transcriptional regulator [marine bacterium AO1-C]
MLFNFGPRSSILLIFFFHGVVFAYLLFKKSLQYKQFSSKWLGGFALLCCLYICPWMLGHAGWYANQPYRNILFYIPTQQVFLLGPFIYFYTQSLLNNSFRFRKKDWLHFIPGFLYLIYSLVVFLTDMVVLKEYYFYENGRDKDLAAWYQLAGLGSMSIYFLASLRVYNHYKKLTYLELSFADQVQFTWVKRYLWAFVLMLLFRVTFLLIYPNWGSFPKKWWYYLFFALLFYYITISGYANTIRSNIYFDSDEPEDPLQGESENEDSETSEKIVESIPETPKITSENIDYQYWKQKVLTLMEADELYKNQLLKITDVAEALETNARVISRMINQEFEMNFNDFVNHYRVQAVKEQIDQKAYESYTLLGIAMECGFNSKTTFNRAFKKFLDMSPRAYLNQQ